MLILVSTKPTAKMLILVSTKPAAKMLILVSTEPTAKMLIPVSTKPTAKMLIQVQLQWCNHSPSQSMLIILTSSLLGDQLPCRQNLGL